MRCRGGVDRTRQDGSTAEVAMRLSVAVKRLRSRPREGGGIARAGLTISQIALLQRLSDFGPATAASLAAAEHVSQQAIAQSVATLKAAGVVDTKPDTSVRRKVMISMTVAGRQLFQRLRATREAWLVRAIDSVIGPRERATLDKAIDLLERLAAADLSPEIEIR